MTDKNTGGPAFPQPAVISDAGDILTSLNFDEGGMTLRDYFAATALSGVFNEEVVDVARAARWCYEMADAMIKERNK